MRMKKVVMAVALLVVAAMTYTVVAKESPKAPHNKQCPVLKKDVTDKSPTVGVVTKSGKKIDVSVCCKNCVEKYSKEVTKYPCPEDKADPVEKLQ
jgi:hypothetical protein